MRPSDEDKLERVEGEPPGWHVREKTETGYPLMGSSPAERQEARERAERLRQESMRDHSFQGEGQYCERWSTPASSGGLDTGVVTMKSRCGYGRDTHPDLERAWDEAHREAWARRTVAAAGKDWRTHLAKFSGAVLPRG